MENRLSKEAYIELMNSVTDKVKEEMTPSIEKSLVIGLVEESIILKYSETKDLKDYKRDLNKVLRKEVIIKENKEEQVKRIELSEDELILIMDGKHYRFNPGGRCKDCPFEREDCGELDGVKCITDERKDKTTGNWIAINDPNENKKSIILSTIKEQVTFWMNSNDIHSPSHLSDISEVVSGLHLNDKLTLNETRLLENKLIDLYYFIVELN